MKNFIQSSKMNHRIFPLILLVFTIHICACNKQSESNRPNILFIMSDDHTSQAIGAYQKRFAKLNPTPGWEFYDLVNDPHENKNAYNNPVYRDIIKKLKLQLKKEREDLHEIDDRFPKIEKIISENWDK